MTDPSIAELAGIAARHEGRASAAVLPRLTLWRGDYPTERTPALFEPRFFLLVQGGKRLTFGKEGFDVGAGTAAVAAVAVPFTSAITAASPSHPYLGLELRIDFGLLHDVLTMCPAGGAADGASAVAIARVPDAALDPLCRLMRLLDAPAEAPLLAPLFEREFWYRVIVSALGAPLRGVVVDGGRLHRVRKAIEWINANPFAPMTVPALAASVDMSVTAFHRHFRAVTAKSPLAYQRHVRLLGARRLLAERRLNVTQVAFATGYASPSQFSREYRAMFGVPPRSDRGGPAI